MTKLINNVHKWWMKLDPSKHYMYWIIGLAGILGVMILALAHAATDVSMVHALIPIIGLGVFFFMILFLMVVMYLVFIWSKEYLKGKDDD